ncbi:MAG: ATP-dependent zinc metalloprotease FtsH [Nitriliruptorales bacterium]|nr:ATP-dependent zinc metalloprotease FtsH [Nitriliruptorales bacterium]
MSGHIPGDDSTSRDRGRSLDRGDNGRPPWRRWLIPGALALLVAMFAATTLFDGGGGNEVDYSTFLERLDAGEVEEITITNETGAADGTFSGGEEFTTTVPAEDQADLRNRLDDAGVAYDFDPPDTGGGLAVLLANLLPLLLIGGLIWWFSRRARGQMSQLTGAGKSKAEVLTSERPDTTFDDIAGYEGVKQEVRELVDYLEDPTKYQAVGARGPGGILLIGPPGTGKTLMARAVAGEADVPFISAAGSEFVEMLVGVGASRVRDLFEKARKLAPSIIFIDELDSLGRKRGGSTTIGTNNEQEQTLNQLLSEMDGFEPAEGVVVIAATNRPQLLDDALMRPGRFDRQIQVPLPRQDERLEILQLHTRGKPLEGDVDIERIARGTPGFSGADLENLVNEAAMHAVRNERDQISQEDFEDARDRVLLGRRQDSDILRPEERRRVAVHESGHALVAALSDNADPVGKVTILPTRRALGVTEQLPLDERRLHTESYMTDAIRVRLGGRVAELLWFDEASSGAANDLATATDMASKMVRDFGLSEEIGPVGYGDGQGGAVPDPLAKRPYAEQTQRQIDEVIADLMRDAEEAVTDLLEAHRDELEELVDVLLEEETVDGEVVYDLVGREPPSTSKEENGDRTAKGTDE